MDPIPVTIIAGSFACGKTTLCNQLLDTLGPAQRNVAVISHRFAEEYACQPVVVHEPHCGLLEEVYDYGSGCLCCTPGGELNQRLNNAMMWGERYDHVLIRTGPAADPLLFADAVQRSSAYRISGLVTVVDSAMLCFSEQLVSGSSLEQLRAADVLLLRSSKVGEDEAALEELQKLLRTQDIDAPVLLWNAPIGRSDAMSLLYCRPDGREYTCKPSSLVPNLAGNLGTIHDTNFKAIQIVENGTVDMQASLKWTASVLSQGFCVRMKALLPVRTENGLCTLLVNATRGHMVEQRLVSELPPQLLMGDLKMLVGNIGQLDGVDPEKPLCRMFLLLGPPMAKGLGDLDELLKSMPSSVDLADSFLSVLTV